MARGLVFRGALPVNNRVVVSGTRETRYLGADYPGSKNALPRESTNGRIFDVDAPTIGSVIPEHGEQPDRRGTSKTDEVATHDPGAGLGTDLSQGPLGRATRAGR